MAARFCPQCGQETSSAAQFCARCGAALAGGPAVATRVNTTTRIDAAAHNTRRLLVPLIIAALVVLAVAVGILANRLHQESLLASRAAPMPAAPPITNAPTTALAAAPLTNTPPQPLPAALPITNAPSTSPGQLPPDVAAYVQFLKGIEEKRIALDNDTAAYSGINAALTGAVNAHNKDNQVDENADPSPAPQNSNSGHQVNQPLGDYEAKWQSLIGEFRSQAPPTSCTLLANNYFLFLNDDFNVVVKLNVGILNLLSPSNSSSETPGSSATHDLSSDMLATQTKRDQEGTAADDALSKLCDRYNAPKPFNIQPEGASSSLLGQ